MNRLKGMKISQLKHEILRLEIELKELREKLEPSSFEDEQNAVQQQ